MKKGLCCICSVVSLCLACSNSPPDAAGGKTSGGGGTSSGETGGGGAGVVECSVPTWPENVYDNVAPDDLAACDKPISPMEHEDGTFAVVLFGPFPKPFTLKGFSFAAAEGPNLAVTDPWTAAVILVPDRKSPLAVDPSAGAAPHSLTLIEELPFKTGWTIQRYSIELDTPLPVAACDTVMVALRNTVGPPRSSLMMCGDASDHPQTNLWWSLDGTMATMKSWGFDRDWWASLLAAP